MIFAIILSTLVGIVISYSAINEMIRLGETNSNGNKALPARGQVKFPGKIKENTITAPLSHSACALWRVEVTLCGWKSRETSVFTKSSETPLMVGDGRREIQVNPQGANLKLLPSESHWSGGMWSNPIRVDKLDPQVKETILKMGANVTELNEKMGVRVYESLIKAEDQIFVAGNILHGNGMQVIASDNDTPVIISELDEEKYIQKLYGKLAYNIFAANVVGIMAYIVWFVPKK